MLTKGKVLHTLLAYPIPNFSGMEITCNDSLKEVPADYSLQSFIHDLLGNEPKGIAIAINNILVPKSSWNSCTLKPLDNILIINATQGG